MIASREGQIENELVLIHVESLLNVLDRDLAELGEVFDTLDRQALCERINDLMVMTRQTLRTVRGE